MAQRQTKTKKQTGLSRESITVGENKGDAAGADADADADADAGGNPVWAGHLRCTPLPSASSSISGCWMGGIDRFYVTLRAWMRLRVVFMNHFVGRRPRGGG
ncbi:unnamed protein product [Musa hybrid cultivar]